VRRQGRHAAVVASAALNEEACPLSCLVPKLCLGTRGREALLRRTCTGRTALLAAGRPSPRSRASRACVPKQSLGTRANESDEAEASLSLLPSRNFFRFRAPQPVQALKRTTGLFRQPRLGCSAGKFSE